MFFIITFKLLTTKQILRANLLLGGGIWLVEGHNWKMDATLNDRANRVSLHLHKEFASISLKGTSMK